MKKQYVNFFSANGEQIDDTFAVKFKKPPVAYKGGKKGKWFELRVSDKTGEITAKYWGRDEHETERIYNSFDRGDVVRIAGTINEYPPGSGQFSISIDPSRGGLRKCRPEEYDSADFVASSSKDPQEMLKDIKSMLSNVASPHLKAAADAFLSDSAFMKVFTKTPAAMEYHQNYMGGLLEHTLNVMKITEALCSVHPELDRELCITGAFLHDIGKTKELEVSGSVIDVTAEGMMVGHITKGYEMLTKKLETLEGFPDELRLKLQHILLSHHGQLEYGSVKKPQLPEALAVHYADDADAQIDLYLRLKREAVTEDQWIWNKKINGHIYLK